MPSGQAGKYKIVILKSAKKFLDTIRRYEREKILEEIDSLADNPRKHGVVKLVGSDPAEYRVRWGSYRIIFEIQDELFIVTIVDIVTRNERTYG